MINETSRYFYKNEDTIEPMLAFIFLPATNVDIRFSRRRLNALNAL